MEPAAVAHIKHALYDMAFLDIKRASNGDSKMGAFILASCFIEYMAGFACGRETRKKDYESFVRHYLPPIYNPAKLYTDLRCKLVHNYSEGGSYWLTYDHPELHGIKEHNRTFINLENLVDDLESALRELMNQIEMGLPAQQRAANRYRSIGLLCVGGVAPGKV
jgi:hypothetical protein